MPGIYEIRSDPLHGAGLVRDKADRTRPGTPGAFVRPAPAPAGLGAPDTLSDWSARFLLADPLDLELMRALRVVALGQQRVQRVEASTLSWMRETRSHRKLGFDCFGDFARAFQMAPRTAHEHVLLHRLLENHPLAEDAFGRADLSLHQVLALAPILKRQDLDGDWLELAARVPVATLRKQAREAAKALESESEEAEERPQAVLESLRTAAGAGGNPADTQTTAGAGGETDPTSMSPPHRARLQLDDALEAALEEPAGRMVSFRAPPSVILAWDHALEIGRCVLGWDAPHHACVEAILAEASPETASVPEPPAVEGSEAHPEAGTAERETPIASRPLRHPSAITTPRPASEESKRRARNTLDLLDSQIKELLSLETMGERGADADAEQAGPAGAATLDDARLATRTLRLLRSKSRPLRVLLSRLLRDLRDTGGAERLGFSSMEDFGHSLGLSERAVRELRSQAWHFQDHPALERAFSQGRVGSEQARLLSRVVTTRGCEAHIARAEALTYRQLAREVRLLERMRQFDSMLADRFAGPFPHPGLEEALKAALIDSGWDEKRSEKELNRRGLKHTVGEAERVGEYLDPACNPIIMRRLEALLEMVVLERSDGERIRSLESLAGAGDAGGDRQTSAHSAATADSDLAVAGAKPDPAAEAADRQTSAQLDLALRRGLHEDKLIPIRFWAPLEIADHWDRAIHSKREEFAVEIPLAGGRSRVEPLPVWAAALMLMHDALSVWELQDPARIPTQRAVLERDECHCRMPWCTHRRTMEAHHVRYRSRQGNDRKENKEADCHGHHKAIHAGYVKVRGAAPHGLIFELGCLPGLPPLLRMHGEKIIEWGW